MPLVRKTEALLARKASGAVYTPEALAEVVVARALAGREPLPGTVLDPACGTGHFLVAAWKALRSRWEGGTPPVARLCGIERDPLAAERCREVLQACAQRDRAELGSGPARPRVVVADALAPDSDDWLGKADLVVGNPPYVRIDRLAPEDRELLVRRFGPWLAGKWDLYHCFLVRALDFLAPGGILAFLTPNQYLLGRSAARLRASLAASSEIREVVDLCGLEPFDRAIPPAAITILAKRPPEHGHRVRISAVFPGAGETVGTSIAGAEQAAVAQARWRDGIWSVLASDPFLEWLDALDAPSLGEFCAAITEGDTRRCEEREIMPAGLAPPTWWPAVRGRDVGAMRVSLDRLVDRLPPGRAHCPRVLVRDVAPRLIAAPDPGGVRCLRTVYCLQVADADTAARLASLLDTDVLTWVYLRLFYSSKMSPRAANFRFQTQFLSALPVLLPPAGTADPEAWAAEAYRIPVAERAAIRALLARVIGKCASGIGPPHDWGAWRAPAHRPLSSSR